MRVLVVKSQFNCHQVGAVIRNQDEIEKILSGEQRMHVIRAHHADETVPVAVPVPVDHMESSTEESSTEE